MADGKIIECWVDGGYSPTRRKGVWCFIANGGEPSYGFMEDPDSELTNNAMEYHAIIELLKGVSDGVRLSINSDSQLVVNQLIKVYKINFEHLAALCAEVWEIAQQKKLALAFHWVSRENNPAGRFLENSQEVWIGMRARSGDVGWRSA